MGGPGREVLVPVLVGLVASSAWCLVEVLRTRRLMRAEPDLSSSSAGWAMRKWFHRLLGAANAARAAAVVIQLTIEPRGMEECRRLSCWALGLAHGVPDLLFLTALSLLTLFWAQLYYAMYGVSYASLRPGFVLANNVVYVAFVVMVVVSVANSDYELLRLDALYLLGAAYLVGSGCMIYFGMHLFFQLRAPAHDERPFPGRGKLLRRVCVLGLLCSFVLILRTAYYVAAVTVYRQRLGYPDFTSRYAFDALCYTVLDVLPSFVILALTSQRSAEHADGTGAVGARNGISATSAARSAHAELFIDASTDVYASMQTTPTVQNDQESFTTRLLRADHELEQQSLQS